MICCQTRMNNNIRQTRMENNSPDLPRQKILVVEDEPDMAELVAFKLKRAGFQTVVSHDGLSGLERAWAEEPDLIILDLMLPGKDGFAVFRDLRRDSRTSQTPVIMLTARAQTEDRIKGLQEGADDYLTKPFSPKELILRVQSVLRRSDKVPRSAKFEYGPFRFDKNNLKFYLSKEEVDLTSTEFKLLLYLCERAGIVQGRKDIFRHVWGYSDEVNSRTLDTHMKRLRKKLGEWAEVLETIRGIGYCLRYLD